MPERRDLRRIEHMLNELGEKERELGVIDEHEYLAKLKAEAAGEAEFTAESVEMPEMEEPSGPSAEEGLEEAAVGAEEGGAAAPGEEEDELASLLQDIEIGLEEQRRLEEGAPEEPEGEAPPGEGPSVEEPGFEMPSLEETPSEETPSEEVPSEEVPPREPEVEMPPLEEGFPPEPEAAAGGPPIEEPSEEPSIEEEPPLEGPPLEGPSLEEPSIEGPPEETPPIEEPSVGEPGEETPFSELEMEEAGEMELDLPEDFDFGDVEPEEGPPPGLFKEEAGETREEGLEAEKQAEEPLPAEPEEEEAVEEPSPLEGEAEEPSIEEPASEVPSAQEPEEGGAGQEEIPDIGEFELPEEFVSSAFGEEEAAGEPAAEARREGETAAEGFEEEPGLTSDVFEMPDLESLESIETLEEGEGPPAEEVPAGEPVSEEPPGPEFVEEEAVSGPEVTEEGVQMPGAAPAVTPEEPQIDLSDEDIVLITTKLRQLDPKLAVFIRDGIVRRSLPVPVMNDILALLIQDVSEGEIARYVSEATGFRVAVEREVPGVLRVGRKPSAVERLYQNLGPLVRVAGLFVLILAVLGGLFMTLLFKPLRALKQYNLGIEYIRTEQYEPAEDSFRRAIALHKSLKQYDRFGWEYMISGNYDSAREKFEAGIKLDAERSPDEKARAEGILLDARIKNVDLRIHLAFLDNILGRYEAADTLYDRVIDQFPGEYEYLRLKGENLIDWGKSESPDKLEDAYNLFQETFLERSNRPDPLFHMLDIQIFRGRTENTVDAVDGLYNTLEDHFPQEVDVEVFTRLALYYLDRDRFDDIRDILLAVLGKDPAYPPAHYAFAEYYRLIGDGEMQQKFLNEAIERERGRELSYPWEKRDRVLLSDSYNDLGAIFARRQTPGTAAEAIRMFQKAIEEDRTNYEAQFNLAQSYFYGERNLDEAKNHYLTAERLRRDHFDPHRDEGYGANDLSYNLGLIYFHQRSFQQALSRWSSLSERLPDNPYVMAAMGSAMLYMEKYSAALGEFLLLSETYDRLVAGLGEIKPWSAYHRRILSETAAVYNNLGVAYEKLSEKTGNQNYQRDSLVALYRAGELADVIGIGRGKIQYNINYIIHPEVIRGDMAIHDKLSDNYRFVVQ